jgi:hypothetical protein
MFVGTTASDNSRVLLFGDFNLGHLDTGESGATTGTVGFDNSGLGHKRPAIFGDEHGFVVQHFLEELRIRSRFSQSKTLFEFLNFELDTTQISPPSKPLRY